MSNEYTDYLARAQREHGERFDPSKLLPEFRPYLHGARVRVQSGERARTGIVSVTCGWRPVFLLARRSTDIGSSDVLGPDDHVTHVQVGREYRPVRSAS